MGDEQERRAGLLSKLVQQVENLGAHRKVERTGGLVEHHQARTGDQRARQRHPLQLPARELCRIALQQAFVEAHPAGDLAHLVLALAARQVGVQRQRFLDDAIDRHARVERGPWVLEHHLHARAHAPQFAGGEMGDVAALDLDAPRARMIEAQRDPAQG